MKTFKFDERPIPTDQEAKWTWKKKTEKKFTWRHIIIKLLKNKGKGKLMMSASLRWHTPYWGTQMTQKQIAHQEQEGTRDRLGLIRSLMRITAIMTSMSGGSVFQDWKGKRNTLEKGACCQIQSDPRLKGRQEEASRNKAPEQGCVTEERGTGRAQHGCHHLLPHKLGRPIDLLQATSSADLAEFTRTSVLNRSSRQQV